MNQLAEAFSWLADPTRWSGAGGIPARMLEHLWYTALGVVIAAVIAVLTVILGDAFFKKLEGSFAQEL